MDTTTESVVRTIPLSGVPPGGGYKWLGSFTAVGEKLYCAPCNAAAGILVVDTTNGTESVVRTIPLSGVPGGAGQCAHRSSQEGSEPAV